MTRALMARYGVAVLATIAAFVPWLIFGDRLEPSPFPLLVAAVAVSSWFGGLGPGLLTSVISASLIVFVYLLPKYSFVIGSGPALVQLASFIVVALLITALNVQSRRRDIELERLLVSEHSARVALESAESTLRTVIQSSPLPIVSLGVDGTVTSWNMAAERIFGWTEAEVLGKPSPTVHDEDRAASDEVRARVLDGEAITGLERRRRKKDGSPIDVSISTAPLYDHEGKVSGSVILAQDITDRRRIEDERTRLLEAERVSRASAEQAQRQLVFLAEASNVLSSSLDYAATLSSVAQLAVPNICDWCAVHVVEQGGHVQQVAAAHVDPEKARLAHEMAEGYPFDPDAPTGAALVLRTGQPEIVREIPDEMLEMVSPDPHLLEVLRRLGLRSSMVVPMIARDRIVGAITFVAAESGRHYGPEDLALAEDLAGRAAMAVDNARLHRAVLEVAAQRETILDQIVDAIIIADASGRTIFINGAARDITGVSAIDVPLGQLCDTYHLFPLGAQLGDDQNLPLARAVLHSETVRDEDMLIRRENGDDVIVQGGATPIITEEDVRLGAVMSFRDVTAQRRSEREKDDFLSAAAHDLKNPLATMKTLSQILRKRAIRDGLPETANLVQGLARIDMTASRMASLINELLDVTRFQMGRPLDLDRRRTDLVQLARTVVREQQHATDRHRLVMNARVSELEGMWDGGRLERVIDNLLSNAIKYSPAGGDIILTVDRQENECDNCAVISVTDTGMGIPAEDLPRVFERFYRAGNVNGAISGTGIGLSSSRQVVEQHGGTLSVLSQEGSGSTFTIRLPLERLDENLNTVQGVDAGEC